MTFDKQSVARIERASNRRCNHCLTQAETAALLLRRERGGPLWFGDKQKLVIWGRSENCRVAVDMDIHGFIHRYIHVWISDLGHTVNISMDMYISFNSN